MNPQRQYWDAISGTYRAITRIDAGDFHYGPLLAGESKLRLLPPLRPGMEALELGCGEGQNSLWLARQGLLCTAIDISEGQLAYARADAAKAGLDVIFQRCAIEDFETADRITYDAAQSSGVATAKVARSTSQALFGSASYNFTYTFNANEAQALYTTTSTFAGGITVDNTQTIGMHIYGDLACDEIWLQLTSADDTQEVLLTNIDFRGWQFREARLDQLAPGKSYRVSAIKVVRKAPYFSNSGSFYLDNMLAYTSSGIQPVATSASIKVYPNPANDWLKIQSEAPVEQVTLYNLAGSCVAMSPDATIDVSSVPAGTYLLKIKTTEGEYSHSILIVH